MKETCYIVVISRRDKNCFPWWNFRATRCIGILLSSEKQEIAIFIKFLICAVAKLWRHLVKIFANLSSLKPFEEAFRENFPLNSKDISVCKKASLQSFRKASSAVRERKSREITLHIFSREPLSDKDHFLPSDVEKFFLLFSLKL